jgi:hypothetical protein
MNKMDSILKLKALAFSLVAMSAVGTVFKERGGIEGGLLLDGLLTACLAFGLLFWIQSKRMERRLRRNNEEHQEQ